MKTTLGLRTSQHLTLTPQLQQSIRLLQMSTAELEQEIERFLTENPLLEIAEPDEKFLAPLTSLTSAPDHEVSHEPAEGLSADDADSTGQQTEQAGLAEAWEQRSARPSSSDDDDADWSSQRAVPTSLRDHLHEQAMALSLSDRDRAWLDVLIESLDDDGYLREPLEELEAAIADEFEDVFGSRLDADEITLGLTFLQSMEPTGIGARSLQECLLLQLDKQPADQARLARQIVADATLLELLARRDFVSLCKRLGCTKETLKQTQALIQQLDPQPAGPFQPNETLAIIPDVIAFKAMTRGTDGKKRSVWRVRLNEAAVPRLTVNPVYADLIRQDRASNMSNQLQEARWVIKNIAQRFETILRVACAIAEAQQLFFEEGELAMKPMVLRDIAQRCELHESTVSRVTTNKYILTPKGTFELKYFFTSHVATDSGETASSAALRAKIKEWIAEEDPLKPLSDQQLASRFAEHGIQVARRTVAKYREALRIDPVSQRKKL